MSNLTFTIGLARSGKSTWAKEESKKTGAIVLSGDDFRFAITNQRFNIDSEPYVRASLIAATKALLISGRDVIVDETNTSKANYTQLLDIKPFYVDYKIVLFHTPVKICEDRAIECNQRDLLPSIMRMEHNLQDLRELIALGKQDKRINQYSVQEIGPIMYHLFTKDPYKAK